MSKRSREIIKRLQGVGMIIITLDETYDKYRQSKSLKLCTLKFGDYTDALKKAGFYII